ncbi:hypothetical protein D4L89_RS07185 [Escherichia coli]|nr:hypothetical protein [Escherichia coli]
MSLLTGIIIGTLAVCTWQVIQLTRRVEKLEDAQNKPSTSPENKIQPPSSSNDNSSG